MGFLRDNYLSEERRVKSEKSKCIVVFFRKHNVANVPADLRSAGMEYQDL